MSIENNGWIDVKDKLPNTSENVICWFCKFGDPSINGEYVIAFYDANTWWSALDWTDDIENNPDYFQISHWQPLQIERPLSKNELRNLKIKLLCLKQ